MKTFLRIFYLFFFACLLNSYAFGQTYIQGSVSGKWTKAKSPYIILQDAAIPASDTLTIDPGVVVKFSLGVSLNVDGTLLAVGTSTDSIKFTSAEPSAAAGDWGGVIFNSDLNSVSLMDYVIFEYGGNNNVEGVVSAMRDLKINHALVQNNYWGLYIGGDTSMVLDSSLITNNAMYGLIGRQMEVHNVNLISNTGGYSGNAGGAISFINCTFEGNNPSAFIDFDSYNNCSFKNCTIQNNIAGIGSSYDDDTLTVDSCTIINNSDFGINGNALYSQGTLKIYNSVIANNIGDGISNASKESVIEQNDIIGNGGGLTNISGDTAMIIRNNIIMNNSGYGIQLLASTHPPKINFNDVYNNKNNYTGLSVFVGDTTLSFNKNNVPSDPYMNICRDPLFVDLSTGDYHLSANSPCINAGDTLIKDQDNSFSDIGAFQTSPATGIVSSKIDEPSYYKLSQNYPNPFNPTTTIQYSIPKAEHVTLKVYDVVGREVATLIDENKGAGSYNVRFSVVSKPLASGIYFYRITAGSFTATKKLILLK